MVRRVARDSRTRPPRLAGRRAPASGRTPRSPRRVPVPIASPRSAAASAAASFTPSPTIATTRPSACSRCDDRDLVGGQHLGHDLRRCRPARPRPAAARRLSPVSSTGRRPSRRRAATASADVGRTVSATTTSPARRRHQSDPHRPCGPAPRACVGRSGERLGHVSPPSAAARPTRPAGPTRPARPSTAACTPSPSRSAKSVATGRAGDLRRGRGERPARSGGPSRPRPRRPAAGTVVCASTARPATTSSTASGRWSPCRSCRGRRCRPRRVRLEDLRAA